MFGTIGFLKADRPAQVQIPNVAGQNDEKRMSKDEAIKTLNDLGIQDITIEEEYNDEVEEGYVISQTPEYQSNFTINVTQPVKLIVSKGQKIVTLPKRIKGKNIEDVKDELDELELKYEIKEETSETVEAGIVIDVDPEAGEEITAATVVNITVSKGSAYKDVVVPNTVGDSEEKAYQTLSALGLVVNITYDEDASKSDRVVTSQNPTNKTIKEGESVNIVVNKQPTRSTLTVNVNLKSLMNYTEPKPVTEPKTDEFGNTITQTPTTPEVEKATVVIEVGEDIILSNSYNMTKTDISQTWTASGVKEVKVKVNGVTKFTQTVDFKKGDQTINVDK